MTHAAPLKSYKGPVTNTDVWSTFALRADDIIVTTPPKCGTTWMLHIVMMLIHGRVVEKAGTADHAPWLDCAFRDRDQIVGFLDGLDRRRCIKSHTPFDGIPHDPRVTYIVVYRHPVDMHFSMGTHVSNMRYDILKFLFPGTDRENFHRFLEGALTDTGTDDLTLAAMVHHFTEAKARAADGNIHFFHYAEMTRNLPGQVARLARILGLNLADAVLSEITEATRFTAMRKVIEDSPDRFSDDNPFADMASFYAEGTSNKWDGRLDAADMAAYRARIADMLPPEDVVWLETGNDLPAFLR